MATTPKTGTPQPPLTEADRLHIEKLAAINRDRAESERFTAQAQRERAQAERDMWEHQRETSRMQARIAETKMDGEQKGTVAIVACAAAVAIALILGVPSVLGPQATIQKGEDTKFRIACIEEGGQIPDGDYLTCLR